jgi:hypothetical protein
MESTSARTSDIISQYNGNCPFETPQNMNDAHSSALVADPEQFSRRKPSSHLRVFGPVRSHAS